MNFLKINLKKPPQNFKLYLNTQEKSQSLNILIYILSI